MMRAHSSGELNFVVVVEDEQKKGWLMMIFYAPFVCFDEIFVRFRFDRPRKLFGNSAWFF